MDDHDRLQNIERQQLRCVLLLEQLTARFDKRIAESDAWRARVEHSLWGDGNGRVGHNVRLDRLEQAAERAKWLTRTLVASAVAIALAGIWAVLKG